MKLALIGSLTALVGLSLWLVRPGAQPVPAVVHQQGPLPVQTALTATPRARFTPTPATRKGYYNIDVVGDFTLPATKKLIFCAAGRNLHVAQDRDRIFRRGFSSVAQTHMVQKEEIWSDGNPPTGWRSPLLPSQRAVILYQNYFRDAFGLAWAGNGELSNQVIFKSPPNARVPSRSTLYQSMMELRGSCINFGDCPPGDLKSTYGTVIFDIENDARSEENRQDMTNAYVYMLSELRKFVSPQTEIGSAGPIPHYGVGYSTAADYQTREMEWHWQMAARHTATSRQRGMPDALIGKRIEDLMDFQMPGAYFAYPDFDYSISHTDDRSRHWLASTLSEQEVNGRLSPKKRIAWQWLFNTQSSLPNSAKAEHPAPPAVAEGLAVFYWFTGAYGAVLWDDHINLIPNQPPPTDPGQQGVGNDRHYACYEHYLHGLWRLFNHHGDLFNGRETYLNDQTECSYDGGQTWVRYNANQLKTRDLPFVRAIVNGDQILVAATKAYARPEQTTRMMLRYVQNGYQFYTTIPLKGDEIYLGRATMRRIADGRRG